MGTPGTPGTPGNPGITGTPGKPEWSRSRYWLCYYLHSRHERPRVPWALPASDASLDASASVAHWLSAVRQRAAVSENWLIPQAARRHAGDPAYVQTLRLWLREQAHHATLIDRWRTHRRLPAIHAVHPHPLLNAGRALGVRYTLSVVLLDDLFDLAIARQLDGRNHDATLAAIIATLRRDKSAHVAFAAERLTMEFADFNAMRRNLRRLRLRGMFAMCLAARTAEHRHLLADLGLSPVAFARRVWADFDRCLEQMVPYRREALIAALLSQQQQPYGRARLGE